MTLSERIRAEVERCRHLYGGVEEYDTVSMDGWIDEVATLEQRVERLEQELDGEIARANRAIAAYNAIAS